MQYIIRMDFLAYQLFSLKTRRPKIIKSNKMLDFMSEFNEVQANTKYSLDNVRTSEKSFGFLFKINSSCLFSSYTCVLQPILIHYI